MILSIYHFLVALFSNFLFGLPSRKIFIVGVTGTKGKSTVVELINKILETAGKKTALLSSVREKVDRESKANLYGNTMPGRWIIQKFIRGAVNAGCDYAIIEVTSEGVRQFRHRFIDWDAAVFVNLAPEHIESHGSFEKYREVKASFFSSLSFSRKPKKYFFLNEEDPNFGYFEKAAEKVSNRKIIFFGREKFVKDELSNHYNLSSKESRKLIGDWFLADFNLENAAAAAAFAKEQGISWPTIKTALDNFKGVPGRLEFIQKNPFAVVIDYAHTTNSLKKVYETLEPTALSGQTAGEMICVLGAAGGGRDKWKRPIFGKIAAEHCDKVILTNEDPFDEDPNVILRQIEEGFLEAVKPRLKTENYLQILNRRSAIRKAISLARKGDVVIITGKGSEPYLRLAKGERVVWSERRTVEEALADLKRGSLEE
ncbi:MAG: UDP-N-acetylmuramyl-tripeptide synthetase [Patescibacteria group bacterium]